MTESEIKNLHDQQLELFANERNRKVIANWEKVLEPAPNGWLLYRIGKDRGIAYTEGSDWENEPWTVVHRLSTDAPVNYAYCPTLEDAVDEFLNG